MQDGMTASQNITASSGNEKSPKKIVFGIGIGCLSVALIISAFFVGKTMTKDDNSDNVANEDIASELAFVQADLASTKQKLQETERALAEATGQQPYAPEISLEEQLQSAMSEAGLQDRINNVHNIENSPVAPFQTVTALIGSGIGSYTALFWRNSTNGEWRFFEGVQNDGDCSYFRSFSAPFAGYVCYYLELNDDGSRDSIKTTVGKYFGIL